MPSQEHRPWRIIARELATETDSQRIIALSLELDRALEKQSSGGNDSKAMPEFPKS